MPGPLSGVSVIDVSAVIVGPTCTRVLADQGADVIKIEPLAGDILRNIGPCRVAGLPARFVNLNRNKRAVCLDLRSAEGQGVIRRLLSQADVFVSNMRPSALERLGLSSSAVREINPRIIHCLILAFGRNGPYFELPAYDPIFQSLSGMAATAQTADGEPQYLRMTMCDHLTGLIAAQCISAALYRRERTSVGESIEVPMFENAAAFVMTEHMEGEIFDPALSPAGSTLGLSAESRPFKTADGYIAIAAVNDDQMLAFFDAIGRADLRTDERFRTTTARFENMSELFKIQREVLVTRTTAEWIELFNRIQLPASRYNTIPEVLNDPHLQAVGFFQTEEHPVSGRLKRHMQPNVFSADGGELANSPAPELGAHTADVLRESGFQDAEIEQLVAKGVVFQAQPARA